jgi:hypothetical protein
MYRQFYEGMDLTRLPVFTLVLFMIVFGVAVVRMFVFGRARDFDHLARMPVSENSSATGARHE